MVESTQKREQTNEEVEREVARRYQILSQESQALVQRLMEIDDERKENQ